jgi:hypothetical protein
MARRRRIVFLGPAILFVLGLLLVAQKPLFGTPSTIPKTVAGLAVLFASVAIFAQLLSGEAIRRHVANSSDDRDAK